VLTLQQRDCLLGGKAKAKTKKADDGDETKTVELELSRLVLDKAELNALLREPHAWDVLYDTSGDAIEPYLRSIKELEFAKPIEGAWVSIEFGLNSQRFEFAEVKLSKVKLSLVTGGETLLSCRFTVAHTDNDTLALMFDQLNSTVLVEIRAEPPGAQRELPLNKFGDGEQGDKPKRGPRRRVPSRDALN